MGSNARRPNRLALHLQRQHEDLYRARAGQRQLFDRGERDQRQRLAGGTGASVLSAYTWNGAAWNNLGSVAGKTTYSYGIDANGDVVGYSLNSANKKMAFYCPYNGSSWGTPVNLGVIPSTTDTASIAKGINDEGQIVGYEYATAISAATAFLSGTTSGSAVALSSLVSNTNGWTLEQATAIDNTGDIVGGMTNAYNVSDAFFLTNPLLPGDANGDGKVDINDLTIVLSHFGQTGQVWSTGDFTGDGKVDINDLTIVLSHFGETEGAAAGNVSAVPEPVHSCWRPSACWPHRSACGGGKANGGWNTSPQRQQGHSPYLFSGLRCGLARSQTRLAVCPATTAGCRRPGSCPPAGPRTWETRMR